MQEFAILSRDSMRYSRLRNLTLDRWTREELAMMDVSSIDLNDGR